MKASHIRLLGLLCLLAGFGILGWLTRKTVTIQMDGKTHSFTTYSWTVGGALNAAGIQLHQGDEISPTLDQRLVDGERISLRQAVPISILADGKIRQIDSAKRTPGEILGQAGISLNFHRTA